MKYHIITFQKSYSRMLAFGCLSAGLVGLSLTTGAHMLPFGNLALLAGPWLAFLGFLFSCVFFIMWGKKPEPKGTKFFEVGNGIQVMLSEELEASVVEKLEEEIAGFAGEQARTLEGITHKAAEMQLMLEQETEAIKSNLQRIDLDGKMAHLANESQQKQQELLNTLQRVSDDLATVIRSTTNHISGIDLQHLKRDLSSLFDAFDATKTQGAIKKLMDDIHQSDLALKKLNSDFSRLKSSIRSSDEHMREESMQILNALKEAKHEVNVTVKQFHAFNTH